MQGIEAWQSLSRALFVQSAYWGMAALFYRPDLPFPSKPQFCSATHVTLELPLQNLPSVASCLLHGKCVPEQSLGHREKKKLDSALFVFPLENVETAHSVGTYGYRYKHTLRETRAQM